MIFIQCTKLLLNELSKYHTISSETSNTPKTLSKSTLGDWHATLFVTNNHPGLFFINDKTLYSFTVENITTDHVKNFPILFKNLLSLYLRSEELPEESIKILDRQHTNAIAITKATNQSVLASMTYLENRFHRYAVEKNNAPSFCRLTDIESVNRIPLKKNSYQTAIELLTKQLMLQNHTSINLRD